MPYQIKPELKKKSIEFGECISSRYFGNVYQSFDELSIFCVVANILPNNIKPLPSVFRSTSPHSPTSVRKNINSECKTVMECQSMSQKCFICELNSVTCYLLLSFFLAWLLGTRFYVDVYEYVCALFAHSFHFPAANNVSGQIVLIE